MFRPDPIALTPARRARKVCRLPPPRLTKRTRLAAVRVCSESTPDVLRLPLEPRMLRDLRHRSFSLEAR